jgi:hypothetical protein
MFKLTIKYSSTKLQECKDEGTKMATATVSLSTFVCANVVVYLVEA